MAEKNDPNTKPTDVATQQPPQKCEESKIKPAEKTNPKARAEPRHINYAEEGEPVRFVRFDAE